MRQITIKSLVIFFGKYRRRTQKFWVPNLICKGGTIFFKKYYIHFTLFPRVKTLEVLGTEGKN